MNSLSPSVEINLAALGTVPEHVLYQVVDGEIVVLDLSSGDYYDLNEVGSAIWTLLLECENLGQVLEKLLQEFNADSQTLCADLIAFIEKLLASGLMELRSDGLSQSV